MANSNSSSSSSSTSSSSLSIVKIPLDDPKELIDCVDVKIVENAVELEYDPKIPTLELYIVCSSSSSSSLSGSSSSSGPSSSGSSSSVDKYDYLKLVNPLERHKIPLEEIIEVSGFKGTFTESVICERIGEKHYLGLIGCDSKWIVMEAVGSDKIGKLICEKIQRLKIERVLLFDRTNLKSDHKKWSSTLFSLMRSILLNTNPLKSYKGTPEPSLVLKQLCLATQINQERLDPVKLKTLTKCQLLTRNMVDAPPNFCNCQSMVEVARSIADRHPTNLKLIIKNEEECRQMGMGGIMAVSKGSSHGAFLIHFIYQDDDDHHQDDHHDGNSLETKNNNKDTTGTTGADASASGASGSGGCGTIREIAFIGKGVTMDTGGYNVKTSDLINIMKVDMGGAAALFGVAEALALLKPKNITVHLISGCCSNMISSDAYTPGDIIKTYGGKTVEILNTDAEGRLILADLIGYAEKYMNESKAGFYSPIVSVATLTGSCLTALGPEIGAVYTTDLTLGTALVESCAENGDMAWLMPFYSHYEPLIDSKVADVINTSKSHYGGSITAGLFLKRFVKGEENHPFIHMDIAGPVWDFGSRLATGWGVVGLTEFILKISAI